MASKNSELLKTAMRLIDGYNEWNIEAIMAPRAPNCTHEILPKRLGQGPMNNTPYIEYMTAFIPLFKGFNVEVLDITEDPKRHQVALHARSTAETALGKYENEYALFLRMTDDAKQIIEMKEFVDSGYSQDYFARLRELQAGSKPQL